MQKPELVREITNSNPEIYKDIAAINDLRNPLTHAFFTENLKRSRPKRAKYKGKNLFTFDGFEILHSDFGEILIWFEAGPMKRGPGSRQVRNL